MANQNPSRRELLEMLSRVAAASQFPGFSRWIYAAEDAEHHNMDETAPPRPAHYQPQFFAPAEYAMVERLVDLIIPQDDSPGAKEAGVAEFIDFMVANDPEMAQPFRDGLKWLDQFAYSSAGTGFVHLETARHEELLSQLAYRKQHQPGQEAGRQFFVLIRRYTVMGYYTSRVGLKELDYPGLRLYATSPACPHVDDPEHKHLPPPRF
jgi:gluconate 2-dehydrogenase gamma chain